MSEPSTDNRVALVLAGGGARGAYEVGALSVLLPELERAHQRPTILIGNSVGALNSSYLAANARISAEEAISKGQQIWEGLGYSDIFAHLITLGTLRRALQFAGEALGWPRARLSSLLNPAHLPATIERVVQVTQLADNVEHGPLHAAAVVATSGLTRRTVVFHHGGTPQPDPRRLIDYVETPLDVEHIRASTAIPAVFPAVHVGKPADAEGWYFDGGTRLNVPIKPALELGARRVVVIGLASLASGPAQIAGNARPDAFAGISQMVQGLLGDQLVQDIHTLARVNEDLERCAELGAGGEGRPRLKVPYILIAPEQPDTIEKIAFEVFRGRYGGLKLLRRFDIAMLGRATGALADANNTTLLSMLMFDSEFIARLMKLGADDARRWKSETHDGPGPLWQLSRL